MRQFIKQVVCIRKEVILPWTTAVRRRGAELVAELLGTGAEVPAAVAGFDG